MFFSLSVAFGGALSPGIPVKQVVPPTVMLAGVRKLEIRTSGPRAAELSAEITASLADKERTTNVSGAETAQALVSTAATVGGAYVGGLVGGGLGGKAVSGLTKGVGAMVSEELENEPLVREDGLKLDVFAVVASGGDSRLTAELQTSDSSRDFTKKEPVKYEDGTFVKDEYGNIVYEEIPCRAVSVTVSLAWTVRGAATHDETWTRGSSDERCGDDLANLASAGTLAESLYFGWGPQIAEAIAPSWRYDRLPMDREPHLVEELKLVGAGAYDRALCGLQNATLFDAQDGPALLGQGVLHEAMGRFDEAGTAYTAALAAGQKNAAKALGRLDERRADVAGMTSAYGLTFRAETFDAAACPAMPSGRRVLVNKPTDLVGTDGVAIAELARGTRLFVVEEGGALLTVAMTDGTQGQVDAKRVK